MLFSGGVGAPSPAAVSTAQAPNDPLFPKQWNLRLIQVPEAWAVSKGRGVTVAVLDSGVAFEDHDDGRSSYVKAPDFAGTRFVPGRDFVDGDDHPNDHVNERRPDHAGHGTHVAAVIAETTDNGLGAAGAAPDASIMPVRVLDPSGGGNDAVIAAGLVFAADHGARVANVSFTGPDTPALRAAVQHASARGVTIVAASGNDGGPVKYPAAYPEVLAVGAVRADRSRAYYSSAGDALDLVAPGGDLHADPANGGIRQQSFVRALDGFCYCQVEGTSAAAPHVAAAAALLLASGRAKTPAQVRAALVSSAEDLGAPGHDPLYGDGLLRASDALAAALAASADLSVEMKATGSTGPGGARAYAVTVANAGPAEATDVVLTDALPPGAVARSAEATQGACAVEGASVTCRLGRVPAGGRVLVRTTVAAAPGTVLGGNIRVEGPEGDGDPADNTLPPGKAEGAPEPAGSGKGRSVALAAAVAGALFGSAAFALRRARRRS